MRNRYHHHDHSDAVASVSSFGQNAKPERIKVKNYHRKKRKSVWYIIGAVVLVCAGILVYEGSAFFSAANNVLSSNINLKDLVSKSDLKQTDNRTNILLLGKGGDNHSGGQLTDTMQVLSINRTDNRVAFISLPRDLQITVPGGGINKLNYAYADGFMSEKNTDKKAEAGALESSRVVEKIIGVPIHYYVTLDFIGFKDLVDALGGVSVDVPKALNDSLYPKDTITASGQFIESTDYSPVSIKAGVQNMSGDTALKYSRSRETTSDFDRSARQQLVMFSIKDKALSLGVLANPLKVTNILNALGKHIKTSMNVSELKEFVALFGKVDKKNSINEVLDNNAKDGLLVSVDEGGYYLKPKSGNFLQIQQMVKNIFNDTIASPQATSVTVNIVNGAGKTGLGGQLSQELKNQGLTVDQITTDTKLSSQSTIYDGTDSSASLTKVKSHFKNPKIVKSETKGIIKVVIGQDYGN